MKPLTDCKLYAFLDTSYLHGRAPEAVAQQLCDGGADLIQLRAKISSPEEIRRMATAILPIVRKANVGLVINDHFPIAGEVGAEFCHLGQEDFLMPDTSTSRNCGVRSVKFGSGSQPTRLRKLNALSRRARITSPLGPYMPRARSLQQSP